MGKGLNYLVEMELGNAPSREYIIRNMKIDPEMQREETSLGMVLQKGGHYVDHTQGKINGIYKQIQDDVA